jgi:hypothetical protein
LQHCSQRLSYGNSQDAPLTGEWIKKMCDLYLIDEISSYTGKWMEVENIILSEVSQAEKAKRHMFSFTCGI